MDDEPIPAATLIVVREAADGVPQLLMVERAEGMAFAAGAMVFPGGRIDDADRALAAQHRIDEAALAAIRETLEETGVPDRPVAAAGRADRPRTATRARARRRLRRPAGTYGLEVDAATLTPFARWVPKFHAVRRFDTLFFVTSCPPGDWRPRIIAGECAAAAWVTAAEILEREQRGQARLIFPTRRTLERLALHGSFEAIRADALAHPIEPVTPWVEERDGEKFITIPAHLGFPVTQERLDGLWRG